MADPKQKLEEARAKNKAAAEADTTSEAPIVDPAPPEEVLDALTMSEQEAGRNAISRAAKEQAVAQAAEKVSDKIDDNNGNPAGTTTVEG